MKRILRLLLVLVIVGIIVHISIKDSKWVTQKIYDKKTSNFLRYYHNHEFDNAFYEFFPLSDKISRHINDTIENYIREMYALYMIPRIKTSKSAPYNKLEIKINDNYIWYGKGASDADWDCLNQTGHLNLSKYYSKEKDWKLSIYTRYTFANFLLEFKDSPNWNQYFRMYLESPNVIGAYDFDFDNDTISLSYRGYLNTIKKLDILLSDDLKITYKTMSKENTNSNIIAYYGEYKCDAFGDYHTEYNSFETAGEIDLYNYIDSIKKAEDDRFNAIENAAKNSLSELTSMLLTDSNITSNFDDYTRPLFWNINSNVISPTLLNLGNYVEGNKITFCGCRDSYLEYDTDFANTRYYVLIKEEGSHIFNKLYKFKNQMGGYDAPTSLSFYQRKSMVTVYDAQKKSIIGNRTFYGAKPIAKMEINGNENYGDYPNINRIVSWINKIGNN